jgi:DNA invertase Pin-like site-specific DNA recombinase
MLIGYMRVSTDTDRQNTNLQFDSLIQAGIDERNIFEDKASGAKDDRAGLAKALEFVKEGDTLVVWKLDRLGRSLPHLIEIINQLKSKGVAFKTLTEGFDSSIPSGELIFHMFGALAQFERSLIKERVNAGLESARKRGRIGGRPKAIEQEKLDAILEALASGTSKSAVCRTFDVKRSTLIDTLKRVESTSL